MTLVDPDCWSARKLHLARSLKQFSSSLKQSPLAHLLRRDCAEGIDIHKGTTARIREVPLPRGVRVVMLEMASSELSSGPLRLGSCWTISGVLSETDCLKDSRPVIRQSRK